MKLLFIKLHGKLFFIWSELRSESHFGMKLFTVTAIMNRDLVTGVPLALGEHIPSGLLIGLNVGNYLVIK